MSGACTLFIIFVLFSFLVLGSFNISHLARWLLPLMYSLSFVVCKEPVKAVLDLCVHACEREMTYKRVCLIYNA